MLYFSLVVYNVALFCGVMLGASLIWQRIRPDKDFAGNWTERFGIYGKETTDKLGKRQNIWIHTVSIGEFLSVTPLIEKLLKKHSVVVTFATKTGRSVAESKFPGLKCLFFPADLYPVALKAVKTINPSAIIIVETEIWPSLLSVAYFRKIPVLLINGRISPSSYPYYKKGRIFLSLFLNLFSDITMRDEREAERIVSLGARRDKIAVAGSMKFDLAYEMSKSVSHEEVREANNIPPSKKIIVFGSLHPAEELEIARISGEILKKYSDAMVIIVPRYLNKTGIYRMLSDRNISYRRKSNGQKSGDFSVLVVDTYGELNGFYSVCDIAFVGASLTPWGGQNPIEPTAFRKPVLFGKYNWHFHSEWQKIKDGGGGIEVDSFENLFMEIVKLMEDPFLAREIGAKGYKVLLENRGATERNLDVISRFLQDSR